MVMSCILLLNLLFCLFKEVCCGQKQSHSQLKEWRYSWHLEEAFVFLGILVHCISLGSSSMVEEEQYTWHFLASTLYLMFLLIAVQSLLELKGSSSIEVVKGREKSTLRQQWRTDSCSGDKFTNHDFALLKNMKDYYQMLSILIVLVCGRLLRGWHQGGVNWVDLPDISKWLEEAGVSSIKSLRIISLFFLMILNSFSIGSVRSKTILVHFVIFSQLVSGLLVFLHIMENWSPSVVPDCHISTSVAQIFYLTVTVTVVVTGLSSPWILPVHNNHTHSMAKPNKDSDSINTQIDPRLLGIRDSMYLTGMAYMASWCLLQLLLQQPINSVPAVLIFLQLFASIIYFSADRSCHEQWVEIVALHFLGMAGHFGLGNSNSLATVDVAGAFIGISNHSTVLSGVLMFIITHASPILSFLSMVVYSSLKDLRHLSYTKDLELGCILLTMIAFPCLLPLVLNSIVLTAFTIVLLLMKDHLFVWSVFSPKYLYVCAMTVSVYIGVLIVAATGIYVITVFLLRRKMLESNVNTS